MRALKDAPELAQSIESGKISVSAVSQVQSFYQSTEKDGWKIDASKTDMLRSLEGQSSRDIERTLLALAPPGETRLRESERQITSELAEIRIVVSETLRRKLHRVRDLAAHRLGRRMGTSEAVELLVEIVIEKLERERGLANSEVWARWREERASGRVAEVAEDGEASDAQAELKIAPAGVGERRASAKAEAAAGAVARAKAETMARTATKTETSTGTATETGTATPTDPATIPSALRRQVWKRADGSCQYVSPETGRRCGTRYALEIDHIHPRALGGSSTDPENLRLVCRTHNRFFAARTYGEGKIQAEIQRRIDAKNRRTIR